MGIEFIAAAEDDHPPTTRMVLAPDVLAKAFHDDRCRRVLELWRSGTIRLLVSPEVLRRYLRVLRALGLAQAQLRRWVLWCTHSSKSVYLPDSSPTPSVLKGILDDVACRGQASCVVSNRAVFSLPENQSESAVPWVLPEVLLTRWKA